MLDADAYEDQTNQTLDPCCRLILSDESDGSSQLRWLDAKIHTSKQFLKPYQILGTHYKPELRPFGDDFHH